MNNKIVCIFTLTLVFFTNYAQANPDTFQFYGGGHVGRTFSGAVIKTDSTANNRLLDIKTRPRGQFINEYCYTPMVVFLISFVL